MFVQLSDGKIIPSYSITKVFLRYGHGWMGNLIGEFATVELAEARATELAHEAVKKMLADLA